MIPLIFAAIVFLMLAGSGAPGNSILLGTILMYLLALFINCTAPDWEDFNDRDDE